MKNRKLMKLVASTIFLGAILLNIGVVDNTVVEASSLGASIDKNENSVKRIELVNLLKYVTLEHGNKEESLSGVIKFKDVNLKEKDIEEIFERLISTGSIANSELFNPNNDLTRGQLSKILHNYFELEGKGLRFEIKDVKKSNSNYNFLHIAISNGLLKLDKEGKVYPNKKVSSEELISIFETLVTGDNFLDSKGYLNINYFDYLLNIEQLKNEDKININYKVDTTRDMYNIFSVLNKELPDKVVIKSDYFSVKQLKDMYYVSKSAYNVSSMENDATLSNYSLKTEMGNLVIVDNTKKGYRVKNIETAYNKFVNELAETLKREDKNESLINVYDYIFDRYVYTASNRQEMLVGNLGLGEMACNGFSRLSKDLLNKVGIETSIREGTSHYWNIINIDGVETTFDVTTDIVKKSKYLTLGNSTDEHIKNTSSIGFYSSEYNNQSYKKVLAHDFKLIKKQ